MTKHLKAMAALGLATALAGCSVSPTPSLETGNYATPIGGAPVRENPTPYTRQLDCLEQVLPSSGRPRVAVGNIADYTGQTTATGGRAVTQGASLMAISALSRVGLPLVERLDDSVAREELTLANNNLVREGDGALRQIMPASINGSDVFLVGGITELNYNISSVAQDGMVGLLGATSQLYVMNIAVDLRLVDTASLDVLDVVSTQKQILGHEIRAGVFEFFEGTLFDISAGERAMEPMQLAVRAMIEHSVGELTRSYFKLDPEICAPSQP